MSQTLMNIRCVYSELVPTSGLTAHPKNRNKHSDEQITRLAGLLKYQGIRAPIIVSKLSHYIVKGHGTLDAIKKNGWTEAPIVYQDFDDEEQEYAFLISDNAISSWSDLDLAGVNFDLADLGPNFDIDTLGIRNFFLDASDRGPDSEWVGMPEFSQDDKTSFRHVVIHFKNAQAAEKFFKLLDHADTGSTRSMWFPPEKNMDTDTRRYDQSPGVE